MQAEGAVAKEINLVAQERQQRELLSRGGAGSTGEGAGRKRWNWEEGGRELVGRERNLVAQERNLLAQERELVTRERELVARGGAGSDGSNGKGAGKKGRSW